MSLTIQITGLEKLDRITDPGRFVQAVDKAIDRSAEALRDNTKKLPAVSAKRTGYGAKGIPVDSGRMRQSIQKKKTQLLAAEVGAYVKYSRYVHDGTGKVPARLFFQFSYEMGGRQRIEELVNHAIITFLNAE